MSQKSFAIALMDAPYESENLTTAFRLLDAIARRGHSGRCVTGSGTPPKPEVRGDARSFRPSSWRPPGLRKPRDGSELRRLVFTSTEWE